MKARRKGTNSPFTEIDRVQLEGNDILYKAEVMEFEHDALLTELETYGQMGLENQSQDHWQDVRERAAIAALQGLCANPKLISIGAFENNYNISVYRALEFADALIEQLKKA